MVLYDLSCSASSVLPSVLSSSGKTIRTKILKKLLRFTCAQAVNPAATQSTPMFKSCVSGRNATQLNSTKVDLSSVQMSSLQKNSTEPGRKP